MKIGVFSDLHARERMLESFLRASSACNDLWFLGDCYDFQWSDEGERCWKTIREMCSIALVGNHEEMAIGYDSSPFYDEYSQARSMQTFSLASRPVTLVHGTPEDSLWGFMNDSADCDNALAETGSDIVICGHTHQSFIYSRARGYYPRGREDISRGKWVLNPGTLKKGQWALLELGDTIIWSPQQI
jgi:predicted phosphodiesterase